MGVDSAVAWLATATAVTFGTILEPEGRMAVCWHLGVWAGAVTDASVTSAKNADADRCNTPNLWRNETLQFTWHKPTNDKEQ